MTEYLSMSTVTKSISNELILAFSIAVLIASFEMSKPMHLALGNFFKS